MDTMATPHRLTLTLAMAAIAVAAAYAADPPAEPRTVASGIAAFEAPAEPPEEDAVPEVLPPEPAAPLALNDALALALMRNPNLQAFPGLLYRRFIVRIKTDIFQISGDSRRRARWPSRPGAD